ncbi:hypothetical protein H1R20_g6183, partial [Candolleomyces eurysporus]
MKLPSVPNNQRWELPARTLLEELFGRSSVNVKSKMKLSSLLDNQQSDPLAKPLLDQIFESMDDPHDWANGNWLFPRAVKLLGVTAYRKDLLNGILLSIGSKTDSTQRSVSSAVVEYMKSIPTTSEGDEYSVAAFVDDLLDRATSNITSNAIVIPLFQTFNILLEAEILHRLADDSDGCTRLQRLCACATKNVTKWKNVQRINEAMKIVIGLLSFEGVRKENIESLHNFLAHPFPKTRYGAAEYLYLQVESLDYGIEDTSEIESILLDTKWSTISESEAREASNRVVYLFLDVN